MVFLPVLRLWSVSRVHGYVTPADFVRGRYGSPVLALIVAITGIVATMPYIALQLVGLEAVLRTMGLNAGGFLGHLPAAHRVRHPGGVHLPVRPAGARADRVRQGHPDLPGDHRRGVLPAREARRLGDDLRGGREEDGHAQPGHRPAHRLDPADRQQPAPVRHAGAGLGAGAVPLPALAHRHPGQPRPQRDQAQHGGAARRTRSCWACWRCSATSRSPRASSRSSTTPPGRPDSNTIIPVLFDTQFNSFFAGIAFAAIGIGALVPAAIMSIAAANLWTRNIYKEYLKRDATPSRRPGRPSSRRWSSSSARCCSCCPSTRSSPSTCSSSAA